MTRDDGNLPEYLQPGRLHVREIHDKNGSLIEVNLEFRDPLDEPEKPNPAVFILGKYLAGYSTLELRNYSKWYDSAILDQGAETGLGNKITYGPADEAGLRKFFALAGLEEDGAKHLKHLLYPDPEGITDKHLSDRLNKDDKELLLRVVNNLSEAQKETNEFRPPIS